MYLNHNFYSNPTLSFSRFRYFTVGFLYLFSQGIRNTYVFLLSELAGYVSGFLLNLPIILIRPNNLHSLSFFASISFAPYPCLFPSLFGLQVCYNVLQGQISSTELYLSLLLITCAPKSFWDFSKFILKLHLDGKLQVTMVYYIYYKEDFSYSQTLWLVRDWTIYTDFENNYMLWSNHYLIFPSISNCAATQFNRLWLQ